MNDASQERMTLLCIYIVSVKTVVFLEDKYKDNKHNTSAFFFLFNFQITRLLVNYVYYYLFLVLFTMQKQNRFPFLGRMSYITVTLLSILHFYRFKAKDIFSQLHK